MKKKLSLMLAVILILQIMLPMLTVIWESGLTLKSVAQENLVTIQFQDENMYNAVVKELEEFKKLTIKEKHPETKTIKMTQEDIDSVTSLTFYTCVRNIKDITGIEHFTNLTTLALYANKITDISKLSNLKKLTSLDLSHNSIQNIDVLAQLTELKRLYLGNKENISISTNLRNIETSSYSGGNNIEDISPLKKLNKLETLTLGYNEIKDIQALSELTNLKILGLGHNSIEDISVLKNMTELEELDLGGNKIKDISALKDLTKLTELHLSQNSISDFSYIKDLTNLTRLCMSSQEVIVNDLSFLENLKQLEVLLIEYNGITDIDTFKNLTKLKKLALGKGSWSDSSSERRGFGTTGKNKNKITNIDSLTNMQSLELLLMDDIGLTNIEPLSKILSLKHISISDNNIEDISPLKELNNLKSVFATANKIKDISFLYNLNNLVKSGLGIGLGSQRIETTAIEGTIINLPKIFAQAKSEGKLGYTDEEFTLKNCTLSEDETKITINENVSEASITINGGELDGSKLTTTVLPKELDSITITQAPTKTEYIEGQTFNKEAMQVTAHYNNGTTALVENYTVSPGGPLQIGNREITVSYKEGNITQTATQAITVVLKGDANGDGKVDFKDILVINKHRLGKKQLTGIYLEAADVTGDGKADFTDILKINKYRLGKISSL